MFLEAEMDLASIDTWSDVRIFADNCIQNYDIPVESYNEILDALTDRIYRNLPGDSIAVAAYLDGLNFDELLEGLY